MSTSSETLLKNSFNRKALLIFVAIVLDSVVTVYLMMQGYGEANPIMAWIAKHWSIPGMAVVKILWSLALLTIILQYRIFNKYIDYLIIGYFALYAGGWSVQFIWEAIR